MSYPRTNRPPKTRRSIDSVLLDHADLDLEEALIDTLDTGEAIIVPLALFHTSPAKGRLWHKSYMVRHRVLADRLNVAAWVE